MPEENDKPKQEHHKALPKIEDFKGVLGWVQKKKEESQAQGKPWSWAMALIAAVIVCIALAYAAYVAWKKGREIAKLKHKIDVDEEKKKAAEADAKIEKNKVKAAELEVEAARLTNLINEGKKQIKETEEERKKLHKKIDTITSWEDLDSF
jgi:septal ring factor EnvC (AmiA/AmiB activator)